MCVSGVRSGAVSCERVCVSCEWASRRSSVVRREAFSFAFVIPKFSCRILNSSFSFEFVVEIFDSNFEFKFLEFSCRTCRRISNSSFSFHCSIRFLESDFEFVVEFDFSNFVSNFKFESVVEIFVSLLYLISRISLWVCCQIRLLEFRCSIRLLEFRFESFVVPFDFSKAIVKFDFSNFEFSIQVPWISNSSFRLEFVVEFVVEFRIRLFVSNLSSNLSSKLLFESRVLSLSSSSNFTTFVARRLKKSNFIAKYLADVINYSRTSAFASLSLPRELCARFSCVKY